MFKLSNWEVSGSVILWFLNRALEVLKINASA
jgi:hypothetical protein